jgi:hypothetical protein
LSGSVGGNVTFKEHVLLRRDWSDLNDRKAFDAAFIKNHDDDGDHALIINADRRKR